MTIYLELVSVSPRIYCVCVCVLLQDKENPLGNILQYSLRRTGSLDLLDHSGDEEENRTGRKPSRQSYKQNSHCLVNSLLFRSGTEPCHAEHFYFANQSHKYSLALKLRLMKYQKAPKNKKFDKLIFKTIDYKNFL